MTLGDITRRGFAVAATAALAALVAAAPPKPASANQDTMVIAIGALPQGIDLDKHVSPQTWSMGAQVFEDGMTSAIESREGETRVGGVRLENMVVVTKDGAEIMDHFPREEILVAPR